METFGLPCKGGKHDLLTIILALIKYLALESPKSAFLDVCGGGGKLACTVASGYLYPRVLYNEYERGMAALLACLTDEGQTEKVIRIVDGLVLRNDPKGVFQEADRQRNKSELDIITAAAYTFYCIYASYANNRTSFNGRKEEEYFHKRPCQHILLRYPPRIHRMVVTCGSCYDILERYIGHDDITSFIDPPYYQTKCYKNNWDDANYVRLRGILYRTHNKVILCGREPDCIFYDCLLETGWYKTSLGHISTSANIPGDNTEEFIWTNFCVPKFIHFIS